MKTLLILISLITISCAQAQWFTNSDSAGSGEPATFYNQLMIGSNGETIRIKTGSADPSSSATLGEIGDLYISSNGSTYQKQDAGSTTNWTAFGGGGGGSPIADALSTTTSPVYVSASVSPTLGQVLTANSGTSASWQTPIGFDGIADALSTTGASVYVSGSAPPTLGQTLIATSATEATWQDPIISGNINATDWVTYTPTYTGVGTVSAVSVYYRRVGDSLEVRGSTRTGTVTGSNFAISLPSGLTLDYGKMFSADTRNSVGILDRTTGGAQVMGGGYVGLLFADGTDASNLHLAGGTYPNQTSFTKVTGSAYFANSDGFTFNFKVPISGWTASGNGARAVGSGDAAATVNTANVTDIIFDETVDTTASYISGSFTAPATANYMVTGSTHASVASQRDMSLYVDAVLVRKISRGQSSNVIHNFSFQAFLNIGEVLTIRSDTGFTNVNDSDHYISIQEF